MSGQTLSPEISCGEINVMYRDFNGLVATESVKGNVGRAFHGEVGASGRTRWRSGVTL